MFKISAFPEMNDLLCVSGTKQPKPLRFCAKSIPFKSRSAFNATLIYGCGATEPETVPDIAPEQTSREPLLDSRLSA
jgi:hypothetical protein